MTRFSKDGIKHLISKIDQSQRDRKSELLSRGWRPVEEWPSLDQTLAHLTYRLPALSHNVQVYLENLSDYVGGSNRPLPEALFWSMFHKPCKQKFEAVKECFVTDEVDEKSFNLGACLEIGWERDEESNPGKEQINCFLIKKIVDYLGNSEFGNIILEAQNGSKRLIKFNANYWSLITDADIGETVWVHWPYAAASYSEMGDGVTVNDLYIQKDKAQTIIANAVRNACCRVDRSRYVTGSFGKTFPIDSFHDQAQSLTRDALQLLKQNEKNHYKFLIKGGSGTCKSQWARAFAKEMLSPLGYFTFMIPPTSINPDIIPWYLPKVCLIVDEFSAESRYDGSDYVKQVTENFLRIFDDSAFEDVIPEEQGDTFQQQIVWIFTSNFEKESNYDPALLRRMDIIRDFTKDANGNSVQYRLDVEPEPVEGNGKVEAEANKALTNGETPNHL